MNSKKKKKKKVALSSQKYYKSIKVFTIDNNKNCFSGTKSAY